MIAPITPNLLCWLLTPLLASFEICQSQLRWKIYIYFLYNIYWKTRMTETTIENIVKRVHAYVNLVQDKLFTQ